MEQKRRKYQFYLKIKYLRRFLVETRTKIIKRNNKLTICVIPKAMYREHVSGAPIGRRGVPRFHATQCEYHSLETLRNRIEILRIAGVSADIRTKHPLITS